MPATPGDDLVRVLSGDAEPGDARMGVLLAANLFVLSAAAYAISVDQTARALLAGLHGDLAIGSVHLGFLLALLITYTLLAANLNRIVLAMLLAGAGCAALAATAALSLFGWTTPATLACGAAVSFIGVATAHATALAVDVCSVRRGLRLMGIAAAGAAAGAGAASAASRPLFHALGLDAFLAPIGGLLVCIIALSARLAAFAPREGESGDNGAAGLPPIRLRIALGDRYTALLGAFVLGLALLSGVVQMGLDASRHHDSHGQLAALAPGDAEWIGKAIAVVALVIVYPRVVRRRAWLVPAFVVTTLLSPIAFATMATEPAAIAVHASESLQGANWMVVLLVAPRSTKYLGPVLMPPLAARLATLVVGLVGIGLSLDQNPMPALLLSGLAAAAAAIVVGRAFGARAQQPAP